MASSVDHLKTFIDCFSLVMTNLTASDDLQATMIAKRPSSGKFLSPRFPARTIAEWTSYRARRSMCAWLELGPFSRSQGGPTGASRLRQDSTVDRIISGSGAAGLTELRSPGSRHRAQPSQTTASLALRTYRCIVIDNVHLVQPHQRPSGDPRFRPGDAERRRQHATLPGILPDYSATPGEETLPEPDG